MHCWVALVMHGGMKTYRGAPAAARYYVEADRGRADDYYLAEGAGVAERYVASPESGVRRAEPLTGDAYEAWVAGVDPETGMRKGRLRHDDQAVRFVELTVRAEVVVAGRRTAPRYSRRARRRAGQRRDADHPLAR